MDYQVINMESLGLPQKRLIPIIEPTIASNDGIICQVYSKILNSATSVKTHLSVVCDIDEDEIVCPTKIEGFGTVLFEMTKHDLAVLTSYYLNDLPFDGDCTENHTMHRLLERIVSENLELSFDKDNIQLNNNEPLPAFVLRALQVIIIGDHQLTLNYYFCSDAFDSLYEEHIGKPKFTADLFEQNLESVPINGTVQLLSKSMTLNELNSLQVGDVVLMDKLTPTLKYSKDFTFEGQISSHDTQLTFKIAGG
ncbi:FliM/FliN family flagellar motor switch protein [Vibrio sp.]|nr:FliM/FliN family flagellar motor switch protein [Vibrio sp.]